MKTIIDGVETTTLRQVEGTIYFAKRLKNRILGIKAVLAFIRANPGVTSEEVYAATGWSAGVVPNKMGLVRTLDTTVGCYRFTIDEAKYRRYLRNSHL